MRSKAGFFRRARKIISGYLEDFLEEYPRLLRYEYGADIEPLHRMRVASRRLRAAIKAFDDILPSEKARNLKKEIGNIGRALGPARQLDVQIRFLESAGKEMKNGSYAVYTGRIIRFLRGKRRRAQKKIYRRLAGLKAADLTARVEALFSAKDSDISGGFDAARVILKRLDKMLGFSLYAYKPRRVKELHLLRVFAKNLRYTLELLNPWYGSRLERYILASRDIQDLLGDLHELDVLGEALKAVPGADSPGFKTALACLKRKCGILRGKVYADFIRRWEGMRRERLWEDLRRSV
ncbi:MAG: CHAD domain-containing protein [Candidatus Omnitrophica bacterium]|jgi:CHAD domain-containing protein|nr:CHAD domain-containing protein [Candidatus Omnitrophota bacterium]